MKLTAKLRKALLEGAAEECTFGAASLKAGIDPKTLWELRKEHPDLDAELKAVMERSIEEDYELARKGLTTKLRAMNEDAEQFDVQALRTALTRYDRKYGTQYKEVDVKATVAVDNALKEVEERGKDGS